MAFNQVRGKQILDGTIKNIEYSIEP